MYGIIDIGSNTMRLNIYNYQNSELNLMLSNKTMVGLAAYVNEAGYLTTKGIDKAIECLLEFKDILSNVPVEKTFVFATASLRNIKNTVISKDLIEKKTGFKVQILSGEEEATLDYVGASLMNTLVDGILVDIGGGSTELVVYQQGEIKKALSLAIGSLSLHNKYVKDFLPNPEEMDKIKKKVLKELKKIEVEGLPRDLPIMCGVGGTVRATCKLKNEIFDLPKDSQAVLVEDLEFIIHHYEKDKHNFLSRLIKVIPDRLHTILPGMIILFTIANHFNSNIITVSKYGVREGYLLQQITRKGTDYDAK